MPFGLIFISLVLIIGGYIQYYVGKIKAANWFVGFRIPATVRDPEVWKAVNIRTGLLMSLHGVFVLVVGLIMESFNLLIFFLVLVLPMAGYGIYGGFYAHQLEKRRQLEGRQSILPVPNLRNCLLLTGLLFILIGCLTYYVGEVKAINVGVGVRISPTYNDPEVWRAVNIRAGFLMALHGATMTVIALITSKVKFRDYLLILILPFAMYTIYVIWYAYSLSPVT